MCGRTSLFVDQQELEGTFDAKVVTDGGYVPRYNIAPGEPLEVITNKAQNEIDQYHWGLIPFWADERGDGLINARSETAHEKRSFTSAWESRPCLVLTSGFYEWKQSNGGPKQPYRIYRENTGAFAMAGLWEVWDGDDETDPVPSVTILTTDSNPTMAPIHDRMPVILSAAEEETWLNGDPDERRDLCRPYPDDDLRAYEISTAVNNPANDRPDVIEPLGHEQSGLGEFGS
jgi:putative SOS response-associated peptidase YedK